MATRPLKAYYRSPSIIRGVKVGDRLYTEALLGTPQGFNYVAGGAAIMGFDDGSFLMSILVGGSAQVVRHVTSGSQTIATLGGYSQVWEVWEWDVESYDFGGRKVTYINNALIQDVIEVMPLIPVTTYFRPAGSATKHRLRAFDFRSPHPPPPAYLTFQSESPFTLSVYNTTKNWNGTLYYSTDTTTWAVWTGTTTLSSVNNKLYLRGTGNTVITGSSNNYRWVLTGTAIECIGNIENLLDWETVALGEHPTMADYCYSNMFRDCTSLATAPELPATTLATYCYYNMFYGCTSLTTAPALPATTLANYCYSNMFNGCTALTTAPELPATTLADNCYLSMFYNCTSLATAPALPATTLATYCYYNMFYGCTSLTTAPALPATTLATGCYRNMFDGCSAFKVSDTQIGSYQYAWRIPTFGAGTTATAWNGSMLAGTGGTFTSNPVMNTTYYVENPPV